MKNLSNIPFTFEVNVGEISMPLKEVEKFEKGVVIDLQRSCLNTFDFSIDEEYVGSGEILISKDNYIFRINKLFTDEEIISKN